MERPSGSWLGHGMHRFENLAPGYLAGGELEQIQFLHIGSEDRALSRMQTETETRGESQLVTRRHLTENLQPRSGLRARNNFELAHHPAGRSKDLVNTYRC
jgi:hypothetical protein